LIKILYSLLNGAVLTGSVRRNFQNLRYFRCPVWKIETQCMWWFLRKRCRRRAVV